MPRYSTNPFLRQELPALTYALSLRLSAMILDGRTSICMTLLLIVPSAASELSPNLRADANLHAAHLRRDILNRDTFDRLAPPTSIRASPSSASGTDVGIQIRFFKVQEVVAAKGSMRLKVWVRMTWSDTRLAWNESEYGGLTTTYFQGEQYAGAETAEIWTPDISAYNADVGLVFTLEPSLASVSSSGAVFYSRPGSLEIMCKFSGLVAFPFDKLSCAVEFGGWGLSGAQQGIDLLDGGYALSTQEVIQCLHRCPICRAPPPYAPLHRPHPNRPTRLPPPYASLARRTTCLHDCHLHCVHPACVRCTSRIHACDSPVTHARRAYTGDVGDIVSRIHYRGGTGSAQHLSLSLLSRRAVAGSDVHHHSCSLGRILSHPHHPPWHHRHSVRTEGPTLI